jgi:hypothetical protein
MLHQRPGLKKEVLALMLFQIFKSWLFKVAILSGQRSC